MNQTETNVDGWTGSYARNTTIPTMKGYMPAALQNSLRTVSKLVSAGNASSTIVTSADQLFLLSEIEIYNATEYSFAGEGSQYSYYKAGNATRKYVTDGSQRGWWTRSPRNSNNTDFVNVAALGQVTKNKATVLGGLSFAFCI